MRSSLSRFAFAALAAAAFDASYAFRGALASGASLLSAALAFALASTIVLVPLAIAAALTAAAAHAARDLLADLRVAATRAAGGHAPIAGALACAAIAVALPRAAIFGRAIASSMSPNRAGAAIALVTIAVLSIALPLALALARALARPVSALERRSPAARRWTRGVLPIAIAAAAILLALEALLPRELVAAPAAAAVAFVAFGPKTTRLLAGFFDRRIAYAFFAALAATTLAAPHAIARLPGRARSSVIEQPPYGSMALSLARRLFDRDGDRAPSSFAIAKTPPPATRAMPAFAAPPSFVVLLVDALRPDRLHFAGYSRATSPRLDRFREEATWFRRAYAPAPSTRFALASLFTGKEIANAPHERRAELDLALLPEATTIAERLDELGYDRVGFTIAAVTQHMPGMGQGFRRWEVPWLGRDEDVSDRDAAMTSDAALAYMETRAPGGRPFLLFAHYRCTHDPYVRHAEHDFGASESDAYDSALAYCDAEIGRVLDAIGARADRDRLVVVVASDHGELLGEHGLDRHGTSLLEPAVRATLLVRVPGVARRTVDAPVRLADVAPAIAALASGAPPDDWSLLPYLAGDDPNGRTIALFVDHPRSGVRYRARGVVAGNLKYTRDLVSGAEQLVDLDADPHELRDACSALPVECARLAAMVDAQSAP
jgi:arylsulfatase A-like enzyme